MMKPWDKQKELKKKYSFSDVPQIRELAQIIDRIKIGKVDTGFQTKRAKALFALYYLTACRASEVTKVNKLRKQKIEKETKIDKSGVKKTIYKLDHDKNPIVKKWKEEYTFLGTRRGDIKTAEYAGKEYLEVRTENRKNKTRKTKLLPIPISLEKEIADFLLDYLKYIEDDEFILFNFTPMRASQIIQKTTGFNLHFIRHIRATHLITLYDFNEQMLVKFMGWTDSRPAKNYMELSTATLAREFYKKR